MAVSCELSIGDKLKKDKEIGRSEKDENTEKHFEGVGTDKKRTPNNQKSHGVLFKD